MKNKKPEKSKVVWYLAFVAFFITIWVIGYFSRWFFTLKNKTWSSNYEKTFRDRGSGFVMLES